MHINGLDEIDDRIMAHLREHARASYSDIATEVGLSRTAVKARIAALEKRGIIKGYRAIIDPMSAPEMMTFVMNVETRAAEFEECKRYLIAAEQAVTVVQTTGNCHLLAICLAPDVKAMRDFVNATYKTAPGILSISAHSVLDVIKGSILPEK